VELGRRSPEELHAAISTPTPTAHKTGARTGDGLDLRCCTARFPRCLQCGYFTMKILGLGGSVMLGLMRNPVWGGWL
jgi:hypothetical protein